MVHRYKDFATECLEGVEDQLVYSVDWAGGFDTPEEAHTWLEENRLGRGEEKQVIPGFISRNRKHIVRCIFTMAALFLMACLFSFLLVLHRYYCESGSHYLYWLYTPWYMIQPHCRAFLQWAIFLSDTFYWGCGVLVLGNFAVWVPQITDTVSKNTFLSSF